MSVFEEQGLRGNPEAISAAAASNLAATKELSSAATEELNVQKDLLKIAEKEAEDSQTGKTLREAAQAYEEARARAERDKGSVYEAESSMAADKLKKELDVAQKSHTSSLEATTANRAKTAVEKAEAKVQTANKEIGEAQAISEMKNNNPEKATWAIKKENSRRTKVYADKLEKDGRLVTAAKVRKGEGSESKKDKLARLAKEVIAEEEKEKNSNESVEKPKIKSGANHP
jgi:hypothetical protein